MNTAINYLYCDASNYKAHNKCIINGVLTEQQQITILSCLFNGEFFIPRLVNLPEIRFEDGITEDDHPFFSLQRDSFSTVNADPTVKITPAELVSLFKKYARSWPEEGAKIAAAMAY